MKNKLDKQLEKIIEKEMISLGLWITHWNNYCPNARLIKRIKQTVYKEIAKALPTHKGKMLSRTEVKNTIKNVLEVEG